MAQLLAIPRVEVVRVWPLVAEHMRRACSRGLGDVTPAWLLAECVAGTAALLLTVDGSRILASAVARVGEEAGTRTAYLLACGGGDIAAWKHVIPDFEAWCRFQGASAAELAGRAGWARIFSDYRAIRPPPGVPVALRKDL